MLRDFIRYWFKHEHKQVLGAINMPCRHGLDTRNHGASIRLCSYRGGRHTGIRTMKERTRHAILIATYFVLASVFFASCLAHGDTYVYSETARAHLALTAGGDDIEATGLALANGMGYMDSNTGLGVEGAFHYMGNFRFTDSRQYTACAYGSCASETLDAQADGEIAGTSIQLRYVVPGLDDVVSINGGLMYAHALFVGRVRGKGVAAFALPELGGKAGGVLPVLGIRAGSERMQFSAQWYTPHLYTVGATWRIAF